MLEAIESLVRDDPLWNSSLKTDENAVSLLNQIISDNRIYLTLSEMMNLYRMVLRANMLEGDMAELGVCRGGSAKLIAETMDKTKQLFLFDSFEGMPEVTPGIDRVNRGEMAYPFEDVASFLKDYPQVQMIKGMFPNTASALPHQAMTFSFVHLDMDTYRSTLEGLAYFYSRMSPGGYILIHDYSAASAPGVKAAVDEFMFDKPESLFDLWSTQVAFSKQ